MDVRATWYATYSRMRSARGNGVAFCAPEGWAPRPEDHEVHTHPAVAGRCMTPVYGKGFPGALGTIVPGFGWVLRPSSHCGGAPVAWAMRLVAGRVPARGPCLSDLAFPRHLAEARKEAGVA